MNVQSNNIDIQIKISSTKSVIDKTNDVTLYIICCDTNEYDYLERENVIFIHFVDTEIPERNDSFNQTHVKRIVSLIERSNLSTITVCCEAGISRSPGLAGGLNILFGKNDDYIWSNPEYRPNVHVYRTFLQTLGIGKEKMDMLNYYLHNPDGYRLYRKQHSVSDMQNIFYEV